MANNLSRNLFNGKKENKQTERWVFLSPSLKNIAVIAVTRYSSNRIWESTLSHAVYWVFDEPSAI